MAVQVGMPAPGFEGTAFHASRDEFSQVTLADLSGKWVCLFFYPMDFSYTCPQELAALAEAHQEFEALGCRILACSCDSHLAHKAWCDRFDEVRGLPFGLLSDIHKRAALDYGVLQASTGVALRGTFLIDPEGVLRWMSVNDPQTGRSVKVILGELAKLAKLSGCGCVEEPEALSDLEKKI
ncbi:MAG: peroxiredoxin [Phycisphaeraceae bacterium]|nr:peroxiredoxin [Phycisphaeraceae bacterium]